MTGLPTALRVEAFKLRRTLALWMVVIAPLLVLLLQATVLLRRPEAVLESEDPWGMLIGAVGGIWAIFMLPLFVTLETALLHGMEHQSSGWKHLFALPVSRTAIYAAKGGIALGLVALAALGLGVGTAATGRIVGTVHAGAFADAVPWSRIVGHLWPIHAAAVLIVAIHHWVAFRWKSMTVALGVGVAGVFFAVFAASQDLAAFYPWLQPARAVTQAGADRSPALLLGLGGGIVFAVLSCIEAVRKDVL